jgi:hypothetical protein
MALTKSRNVLAFAFLVSVAAPVLAASIHRKSAAMMLPSPAPVAPSTSSSTLPNPSLGTAPPITRQSPMTAPPTNGFHY